ncbi:hypothetical protein L1987_48339 [Smallanthus sonchifolius]|uniref:Uncharacterized protein n=1 Tax=Smallanthus sonchifolius TaxID=185202 RepID=A0ACB9FRQ7_9ASTR|nr:hypothetical protein L1987_48339 [Smallanthus sonchifolius]
MPSQNRDLVVLSFPSTNPRRRDRIVTSDMINREVARSHESHLGSPEVQMDGRSLNTWGAVGYGASNRHKNPTLVKAFVRTAGRKTLVSVSAPYPLRRLLLLIWVSLKSGYQLCIKA